MDFPGHFQHIFRQLNQQRLHSQLCDCLIVVGDQNFRAHRSILAACSSHFHSLLTTNDDGSEATGGNNTPTVMKLDPEVVTPEAFSTLLDMIYTSKLSLEPSNAMDVLLAASHLHLNTVVKACKGYLSRKNFPTSAPRGWRRQHRPHNQEPIILDLIEDLDDGGVEVSQSGGDQDICITGVESQMFSERRKRKSQEEKPGDMKKAAWSSRNYRECSPTVTRSTEEKEEMMFHADVRNQGFEEQEKKYETHGREAEEVQLPTQSDSSRAEATVWGKTEKKDENCVVKVKVGEEEGEEPKMPVLEVKQENVSSHFPHLDTSPVHSSPPHLLHCTNSQAAHSNDEKVTLWLQNDDGGLNALNSDDRTDVQKHADDLSDDVVDGESLESFSELAFSCFLNPSSTMGSLEGEDSLASLTAAATAAAAAAATSSEPTSDVQKHKLEEPSLSSATSSDSSSSLVFPVTSVHLQQLLPTSNNFNDTIILQPAQNSFPGFLSGLGSGLNLDNSHPQPSRTGKTSKTAFRRIAPKAPPESESTTEPSADEATDQPPLARASEDVLLKCKKAASEDLVLLVQGEKKYACKICNKTFMNLTDCKKHIRVHTGEKPYPCQRCGKHFSQSSHLYKHLKSSCLN